MSLDRICRARTRLMIFVAAGPATGLLLGVIGFVFLRIAINRDYPLLSLALACFVGYSVFVNVASLIPGRYDRWTAVYDISAHKVYMPDGTTLEAHSGYGNRLDDPRHVDERMRGATPPTVYDLKLRESLFHGVQAIRLIPEDEDHVFGRSGLLAHTYMLGPNGDSNGCVSFRNYNAFLQAYLGQKIKRLAVVTHLE